MTSPRMLCLWLPNWPIQRRLVAQPELDRRQAILLVEARRGARRVAACSRVARQAGVRPEMPLAEADALLRRSRSTGVVVLPHRAEEDLAGLRRLARQCDSLSPCVGWQCATPFGRLDANPQRDCLFLDATNLGPLFGGERRLLQTAGNDLREQGYAVRSALADTVGAAWAAAHWLASQRRPAIRLAPGRTAAALAKLPIQCLRLPEDLTRDLHRLGVRQVEQAAALPRQLVPARLGDALLWRLDLAWGRATESIEPVRADPPLRVERDLEPPASEWNAVLQVVEHLLPSLLQSLQARQHGVTRLHCRLRDEQGGWHGCTVGLYRPCGEPRHLLQLLLLQAEQHRDLAPITRLVLSVQGAPLPTRQAELFEQGPKSQDGEVARLIDRLSSRLGRRRVLQARLTADPQPELAWEWRPWTTAEGEPLRAPTPGRRREQPQEAPATAFWERPPWIFQPPRPLIAQLDPQGRPRSVQAGDRRLEVAACWGPERIETGWWRGPSIQRAYYRIQDPLDECYWIYRDHQGRWWLHGRW